MHRDHPPLDLFKDGLSKLDSLPPDDLAAATKAAVERAGGAFPEVLAQRLDQLFAIKCARVLQASHEPVGSLGELDDLIARVGRERFRPVLDGYAQRFYSRWSALRNVLAVAMSIAEHAEELDQARPPSEGRVWTFVAELVLREAAVGVPWSEVAAQLEANNIGPSSKSGVSNLISAMRNAGWLETVSEGRKKRVFPGRRIHSSSVYDALLQRTDQRSGAAAASREHTGSTALVREVVCLNQGKLIEYDRISTAKHLLLCREVFDRETPRQRPAVHDSPLMRRQRMSKLVDDLDGFLQGTFRAVAQKNFSLIKEYFSRRSETMPRICIKGNWQAGTADGASVSTVIRDDDVSYTSNTPVTGNTAFARTVESGRWCLFNDIPKATFKGVYKNPRLNMRAVQQLMAESDVSLLEGEGSVKHARWARCWADFDEGADPRAFYRSTLVIPMTLRNNNLGQEFLRTFKDGNDITEGWDRTVVGFLCFDHVDLNFFDAEIDVHLGYVLADLMSIYLFKWVSLTRFSADYTKARSQIAKAEPIYETVDLAKALMYFERELSTRHEALDLKPTSRNTVLPLTTASAI